MIETRFKNSEVGLIPEDWEIDILKDICSFRYGYTDTAKDRGNARFVRITDIKENGYISSLEEGKFVDLCENAMPYVLKNQDILMARTGATFGKTMMFEEKYPAVFASFLIKISIKKGVVNRYYFHFAQSPTYWQQANSLVSGGAQPQFNSNALSLVYIPHPNSIKEQENIATALSNIDSLISNLEELIEKKRNIKQGVMQELLSGKRRLKGYEKDWGWQKVFDLTGKISRGQTLKADDFKHGEIPVIAGGRQYAGYHNIANHLERTITISGSGASAGYVLLHNQPIFATDCSVISESVKFDLNFLYYCLRFHQDDLFKLQTGGAQPHVYPRDIQALDIFIPSDKNEQIAIANVLTDMEDEIRILEERLDKYQALKQGMMQQLLTGKIRLI